MKYYNLKKILLKNAQYNMVIGKRSNGKTYACLDYGIKQYFETGAEMAYIRRQAEDLKPKRASTIFNGIIENRLIEKYSNGVWTDITFSVGKWYFCRYEVDNEKGVRNKVTDEKPFCYAFSLSDMEHDKSTSYPKIKTIIFDEFITRYYYMQDEFIIFMNVLSTITRSRTDVKIFMLANTVNKFCPYFAEMGLKNVKTQKIGTIDVYEYGQTGLKVAVEYVQSNEGVTKDGNMLFAFDNPRLKMITHGTWEIDIYPHLPIKYKESDILFQYFIKWDGEILHCEIIRKENYFFTYIHMKTTDIQNEDKDIIFQSEPDARPNYYTRLNKPCDKITNKIADFYKKDKVFYQNNEVGEIVNNYLKWCS